MPEQITHVGSHLKGHLPNELVYITWTLTSTCNFSCSYCPEELHDKEYKFPAYEGAINFIGTLITTLPKNAYINLAITGGEPSMWPKLVEFLKAVETMFKSTTQKIVIQIDTNLSRTNRYWQDFVSHNLGHFVVLHPSYHADEMKHNDELFYDNLEIISQEHLVNASFLLEPKNFDHITNLIKRINATLPVDTMIVPIRDNFKHDINDDYTPEQLEYITDLGKNRFFYKGQKYGKDRDAEPSWPQQVYYNHKKINFLEIIAKKQHSFKGWKCSAGSRRFFIEPNGDVYPCSKLISPRIMVDGKRKFASDRTDKNFMGNINEGSFEPLKDYITCPENWCPCRFDVLAEKVK